MRRMLLFAALIGCGWLAYNFVTGKQMSDDFDACLNAAYSSDARHTPSDGDVKTVAITCAQQIERQWRKS